MIEVKQTLPWLARRYCSGDESWTDWRSISQAEFEHRKDDDSFEFMAAPKPAKVAVTPSQALVILKSFWQGDCRKAVTHQDREDIEEALTVLSTSVSAAGSCEHKRMTTTALGAATNAGWTICGKLPPAEASDRPSEASPTDRALITNAARYEVLRRRVSPGDVRIQMTKTPPEGQTPEERIDMLCDLVIEAQRSSNGT